MSGRSSHEQGNRLSSADDSCNARPPPAMNGLSPVRTLVGAAPHQGSRPRACTSRAKAVGCVARRPWEPYVAVTAAPEAPRTHPISSTCTSRPRPSPRDDSGRNRGWWSSHAAEHPEKRSPAPAHGASAAAARTGERSTSTSSAIRGCSPGVRWSVSDSWSSVRSSSREPTRGCGCSCRSFCSRSCITCCRCRCTCLLATSHCAGTAGWCCPGCRLPTRLWTCSCLSAVSRWRSWTTAGDT